MARNDRVTNVRPRRVSLGRIVGLFGVKGWVKVLSYTDPRDAILEYDPWLVLRDGDWQSLSIAEGKRHGKAVIVRVDGVDDRDAAAALIGCDVAVPRDALPDTDEGTYYWADLEGMRVLDRGGNEIGTVAYLLETGANDVLVIDGDSERLIPFVPDQVVLDVDTTRGIIKVDWDWD